MPCNQQYDVTSDKLLILFFMPPLEIISIIILSVSLSPVVLCPGLFDMALKSLFFCFFLNLKSPNLGFLENKNLMSDLIF